MLVSPPLTLTVAFNLSDLQWVTLFFVSLFSCCLLQWPLPPALVTMRIKLKRMLKVKIKTLVTTSPRTLCFRDLEERCPGRKPIHLRTCDKEQESGCLRWRQRSHQVGEDVIAKISGIHQEGGVVQITNQNNWKWKVSILGFTPALPLTCGVTLQGTAYPLLS